MYTNSGKTMVYPKWGLGQPNNKGGDQEFFSLMRTGEGNDRAYDKVSQYLCQKTK